MRLTEGELASRARDALARLASCDVCAHRCNVDRRAARAGACDTGPEVPLAGYALHFGEEPMLVGKGGSGLVLLGGCNLACTYCETADFSLEKKGVVEVTPKQVAGALLELARRGAVNVNFVTPTHVAPQLVEALRVARARGFDLPVVWNCGGYESLEMLRLLDGIVDVYLPDFKYGTDEDALVQLSKAPRYATRALEALREMQRQVGDLVVDADGVARRGLLVRHLVLPGRLSRAREAMLSLATISTSLTVNLMSQYTPCHATLGDAGPLGRRPLNAELAEAREAARGAGLVNVLVDGQRVAAPPP